MIIRCAANAAILAINILEKPDFVKGTEGMGIDGNV